MLSGSWKMSHDMTKPTKWVCAQRRLRSAWASAHSHFVGFVMSRLKWAMFNRLQWHTPTKHLGSYHSYNQVSNCFSLSFCLSCELEPLSEWSCSFENFRKLIKKAYLVFWLTKESAMILAYINHEMVLIFRVESWSQLLMIADLPKPAWI